jgi:hypothetical protein
LKWSVKSQKPPVGLVEVVVLDVAVLVVELEVVGPVVVVVVVVMVDVVVPPGSVVVELDDTVVVVVVVVIVVVVVVVVDVVDVVVVLRAVPGACRKCDPKVATPVQKAVVSAHVPTSTVTSTVSRIASLPPSGTVWSGPTTPQSGPSPVPSISPRGSSLKFVAREHVTSEDSRLLTKASPHWETGEGHEGSAPVAQAAQ